MDLRELLKSGSVVEIHSLNEVFMGIVNNDCSKIKWGFKSDIDINVFNEDLILDKHNSIEKIYIHEDGELRLLWYRP